MLDYETCCQIRDHLGRQQLSVAQTARALALSPRTVAKRAGVEQFRPRTKQFRRLRRMVKRQRTILGVVIREVQRKMQSPDFAPRNPKAVSDLMMWLERAERIRTQQRHGKNK